MQMSETHAQCVRLGMSALDIPLFRILPLFLGYCCILTGSLETMPAHVSAVLSSWCKLHVRAVFATKEGTNLSLLLCSFFYGRVVPGK